MPPVLSSWAAAFAAQELMYRCEQHLKRKRIFVASKDLAVLQKLLSLATCQSQSVDAPPNKDKNKETM